MPLVGQNRRDFLKTIMQTMHARQYVYNAGVRGYQAGAQIPPPGSQLNCEGASLLMRELALTTSPQGSFLPLHLRVVRVAFPNRMLLPWHQNMRPPLGGQIPAYVPNVGWVFENHYRLRDLGDGNRLYDPTFCTMSPDNYDGIEGSTPSMFTQRRIVAEVFGEQYLVITNGVHRERFALHQNPANPRYFVSDGDYV
jgi:hypothetical protein